MKKKELGKTIGYSQLILPVYERHIFIPFIEGEGKERIKLGLCFFPTALKGFKTFFEIQIPSKFSRHQVNKFLDTHKEEINRLFIQVKDLLPEGPTPGRKPILPKLLIKRLSDMSWSVAKIDKFFEEIYEAEDHHPSWNAIGETSSPKAIRQVLRRMTTKPPKSFK